MLADQDYLLPKPRDTVELPSGRLGMVMAVVPDGRREVQYLDVDGGSVILHATLLRVRINAKPEPWSVRTPRFR